MLLLALLGVGIALFTLDLNQFVGPVLARIKAATGREVTVGGSVESADRIRAEGRRPTTCGSPTRRGARRLISSRRRSSSCRWRCCRCLRRQFELVRLQLVEPVIALETDNDGRGNWELGAAPATVRLPRSMRGRARWP